MNVTRGGARNCHFDAQVNEHFEQPPISLPNTQPSEHGTQPTAYQTQRNAFATHAAQGSAFVAPEPQTNTSATHIAQARASTASEAQPSAFTGMLYVLISMLNNVVSDAKPLFCFLGRNPFPIGVASIQENNNANKKKRGPTYMTSIWGRPKSKGLMKVDNNKLGLPIGKHRKSLVAFLGTIARNPLHCPIFYQSWTTMPNSKKVAMVEKVKVNKNPLNF